MASDLRLATVALLKTELRIPAVDTDADTEIGNLLDRSTAQIESYCGRQLVYRDAVGPYVEYHTIKEIRSVLFLNDFPVIGSPAIEVKESASSDWTVDALVNGTDYIVRKQRGVLQRVSAKSTPYQWQHGVRVVRVTYAGGYEDDANDKANVPQLLSDVCLRTAAAAFREVSEKLHGIQVRTDTSGAEVRGLAPRARVHLSDDMKTQLDEFVWDRGIRTGEQDN